MGRGLRFILGLCLLITPVLTGCWDRMELNEISIITSVALDKTDDELLLSVTVLQPRNLHRGGDQSMSGGTSSPVEQFQSRGKTIFDAFKELNYQLPRQPYWGQVHAVVFNTAITGEEFFQTLDFFARYPEARRTTDLFLTAEKAAGIIWSPRQIETLKTKELHGMANQQHFWNRGAKVTLQDLFHFEPPMAEVYLPRVYLVEHAAGTVAGTSPTTPKKIATLSGLGVLKQGQFVGWLTETETFGVLWLLNKVRHGPITVDTGQGPAALRLLYARTKIRVVDGPNGPTMLVKIRGIMDLVEAQGAFGQATTKDVARLQELAGETVRQTITQGLGKVQSYQTDILGFGREIYRYDPTLWAALAPNWPQVFSTLPVDIQVDLELRRTGLISRTITPENPETKP
ncbi:MAG: Ger(x)C family spore germination protein [Heliobacteriaceae bacterium]|nr:Ger(x)C family spore germination protein [Heliobacteriaceae bacterium]MDD4588039.1 Ger(x)C family spore germination protein [Heliobacteriaceae bacterium]